jgi:hypothetical protein
MCPLRLLIIALSSYISYAQGDAAIWVISYLILVLQYRIELGKRAQLCEDMLKGNELPVTLSTSTAVIIDRNVLFTVWYNTKTKKISFFNP